MMVACIGNDPIWAECVMFIDPEVNIRLPQNSVFADYPKYTLTLIWIWIANAGIFSLNIKCVKEFGLNGILGGW